MYTYNIIFLTYQQRSYSFIIYLRAYEGNPHATVGTIYREQFGSGFQKSEIDMSFDLHFHF